MRFHECRAEMDLRDKLKVFESDFQKRERRQVRSTAMDIDQFVSGEEMCNDYGRLFRSVTDYPQNQQHGRIPLELLWEADPNVFRLVGKDEALADVDLNRAVFLDTETTGLAGGAGTVPFLVGLGYFTNTGFQVEQFFMRDFDEEQALLHAVRDRLQDCTMLVSYNGKCYDLNVLLSRFTLSRMDHPLLELPHLDLLFTARRLWRRRIGDCSLTNVEQCVLGFHRVGDVPGFLIPGLYFDYLRSRNGQAIEPVFRHNRWDIVALVALTALTGQIYQSPKTHLDHPLDLLSLGKALENVFCFEQASACFQEALNYPMMSEEREDVLRMLGFCLKRMGHWDRAVKVWEHMVDAFPHRIFAYEELAKYHEHRSKNIDQAVGIVERALERIRIIEELRSGLYTQVDRKDLEYRLRRLNRKLKKR
jgi:uncharacterized protein YprB with RNaseH-like and TPR domain